MHMLQPFFAMLLMFVVLPWLVLHYTTQWKRGATLSREDEQLLDQLHDLGRRLDDRMGSIERILADDNPGWRSDACETGIPHQKDNELLRRIK